ncbi:MAG TPA: hypothetical protein VF061_09035 [Gemmatimonadales bacterium]
MTGTVVRPSAGDTVPVSGARVVLHRVGSAEQGPVDSVPSGAGGRFRFALVRDTADLYLLSARYQGIEYFTLPLDRAPERDPETVTLVVHDTSSRTPVTVSARHVVIPRPGDDGTREVLDLILLANAGTETRVAPDSQGASWSGPLPPESEGLDLGESDVSPDAVTRRGDSVIVSAPISPGEKQLAFQYHLRGGRQAVELPVGAESVALSVLLEEPAASVSGPGLVEVDGQTLEGRSFRRWSGDVPANAVIRIALPGAGSGTTPVIAVLVTVLALALVVAAWRILARGRTAAAPPAVKGDASDRILNEIAALDARYEGREAETPSEEWSRYRERRAALKAEAAAALARGSRGP